MSNVPTEKGNDANSSVNDQTVTHGKHEQPQEQGGDATQRAIQLLKEKRSQGHDFIKGSLSRKQAENFAKEIREKHGVVCKHGVVYKAKEAIKEGELKQIGSSVDGNLNATIVGGDDDFSGGSTVKVEDGDKKPAEQQGQTGAKPDEKHFEPLPPEAMKDIIDVVLDGVSEGYETIKKPIRPKALNALKVIYTKTLEAYNQSLPKWLLIPFCLILTVIVLVLPIREEISNKVNELVDRETAPAQAAPQ